MAVQDKTPRSAWFLLAFLTLLNLINFVDRQLITSLQIPLRKDPDLHLTDRENQLLAGYAFTIVYCVAGLLLGSLADRWHRPRLIALGLLVWSIMTAASGLARDFWELAAARVFVAVGEATLTPAAVAMIADVFRPRERSLASGLYYLGIPFGASLCLIVANLLWPIQLDLHWPIDWIGWRGCFLSLGLVGLTMVVVLLFVKDPPRGAMEDQVAAPSRPQAAPKRFDAQLVDLFRALRTAPAPLLLTMVGAVLANIAVGSTWLDSYWLYGERGFTAAGAPIFLGACLLVGGSAGNILGGWLGDRLNRRWAGGRLLALVVIQLGVMPFAIAYRFLPGDMRPGLAVCCVVGSIMVTFIYGPVLATVQELTPPGQRATMVAFLLIGLNLLGASLGSVLAAELTKWLGSYTWGIFLTAQAGLISIPIFLLAFRRYRTDLAAVQLSQEKAL